LPAPDKDVNLRTDVLKDEIKSEDETAIGS
jgi:hypothetical protein